MALPPIPQLGCDKCDGYGHTSISPLIYCKCYIAHLVITRLHSANIPPLYHGATLQSFKTNNKFRASIHSRAVAFVKEYHSGGQGLFLLSETCGTGKTHIAISILRELILRGFVGQYFNVTDLLDTIRENFSPDNADTDFSVLSRFMDTPILVLDDIGLDKSTDWVLTRLYLILNHRYTHCLTTILTSNLKPSELVDKIGQRLYSRLQQMCIPLPCPGTDFRMEPHVND